MTYHNLKKPQIQNLYNMAHATPSLPDHREIPPKHTPSRLRCIIAPRFTKLWCDKSYHTAPNSISKPSILSCKTYKILTTVIKERTPCESLKSSILEAFPQPPQQSPILVFRDVVQNTAHSYYSRQVLCSCLKPSSCTCHLPFHFPKAQSIVIPQLLKW